MAQSSKSYVGIARGIKSHELSTKSSIESLKNTITSLRGRISSLNYEISGLNAELAAARADVDEDGNPNYALISRLEQQISMKQLDLSIAEQNLDSAVEGEREKQQELSEVQEEKAQTLFEIQERARTTSKNINAAGGMYGAYAGIGQSLQQSFQSSYSSLASAASILGGTVAGAVAGGVIGGSSPHTASPAGYPLQKNDSASAFISHNNDSYLPTAERYGTDKTSSNVGAFGSAVSGVKSQSINPQKVPSYSTSQKSNNYLLGNDGTDENADAAFYTSKTAGGMEKNFKNGVRELPKEKEVASRSANVKKMKENSTSHEGQISDRRKSTFAAFGISMSKAPLQTTEGASKKQKSPVFNSKNKKAKSRIATGENWSFVSSSDGSIKNFRKVTLQGNRKDKSGNSVNVNRNIYQYTNIDPNLVVHGKRNIDRMRKGYAPYIINSSGKKEILELHHLTGEEFDPGSVYFTGKLRDGSLIELPTSLHRGKKSFRILHGLNKGQSFRKKIISEKDKSGKIKRYRIKTEAADHYNAFRSEYWRLRAAQYDSQN